MGRLAAWAIVRVVKRMVGYNISMMIFAGWFLRWSGQCIVFLQFDQDP
jgi:hypothetical protein